MITITILYIIGFIIAVILNAYDNYQTKKLGYKLNLKPSFYLPLLSWAYVFAYFYYKPYKKIKKLKKYNNGTNTNS